MSSLSFHSKVTTIAVYISDVRVDGDDDEMVMMISILMTIMMVTLILIMALMKIMTITM